ncbi:LytR C-terminal domain-containing protein [Actinotalea subterranea]|uniref:LytR C-terminal domain-containing protein n=1 Tax=Actinotalea subterranea TaxID=2607497 RepID=UPI0011EF50AC|nr:LytR C-terminal domain-containing protein [Actinotalea subterranea]
MTAPDRDRNLRRRHMHERQAVVFGSLVAALAVAALASAAVYTGALSVPFLERDFTSPSPEPTGPNLPDPPCPPEGTLPVAANAIQVSVFNGAGRSGLAAETSTALAGRGFVVLAADNYPARITTTAQITFGEAGIAAGYTMAAYVDGATLVMDKRADATVDLVVGEAFTGLTDPAAVALDPATALTGVEGCVPLETARENALPAATPTAAPEDEVAVEPETETEG